MKKPSNFLVFFLLSLIIFALDLGVYAQNTQNRQPNSTISGHIFNSDRLPISEIYVELLNEVNSTIARVKTNSGGRVFFAGLSSGTFTIRALPHGTDYEEQSVDVSISSLPGRTASETVQQDLYLRVRRDLEGKSITGTIFAQEIPENSKRHYEKGIDSLANEKADAGIESLNEALKIFPTYYAALERLGQAYIAQQKWEHAYGTFKKAVEVNARGYRSWYGLSFSAYEFGKIEDAGKAAQEAVNLNGSSPDAALLLGICQRKLKQYQDAERSFKSAGKLSKGRIPDVHWNLALLYAHNLMKFNAAADELEQYLKIKKDAPVETIKKLIKQFRDKATAQN